MSLLIILKFTHCTVQAYIKAEAGRKARPCCCFSTGTLQGTNVPRPTLVSSNCATHHGLLRRAVGDFVTPFVLEKLFDHSCSLLNLQVHTWGMSLASSGKFV